MKGIYQPSKVPKKWRDLMLLLPGYDCFAHAEGFIFNANKAKISIEFIEEYLTHMEGSMANKPFIMEDWQRGLIACLFGWQKPDVPCGDHLGFPNFARRYREFLLYIPRKNGKTPLSAAILACVFFLDNEMGAQCYIAAGETEQAAALYRHLEHMIQNCEDLDEMVVITPGYKRIVMPKTKSFMRVISAKADTKHGGNSHCCLIDELHVQPNRKLVDVLQTSMVSDTRKQPLAGYLTTADEFGESICNEVYERAKKIRDNKGDRNEVGYDPSFLPVIFEADRDDDWMDPATWKKANPNLGISVSYDAIEIEARKARDIPSYLNTFLQLHLNVQTEGVDGWLDMSCWNRCADQPKPPGDRESKSGLDLALNTDLAALVTIFEDDDDFLDVYCHFWMAEDTALLAEKRDSVPYLTWARQGLITLTPGNLIDYGFIRKHINDMRDKLNLSSIALDMYNAVHLATELSDQDGFHVMDCPQGYKTMSSPSKDIERCVKSMKLRHGNNPVLKWMASNTAVDTDAVMGIRPTKKKSRGRIDGIVALVMADALRISNEGPKVSCYEKEGLLFL